jgi:RimJ/RimL family protein N-acetyltransferase
MSDKIFGDPVENWTPPPHPDGAPMRGRYALLEKIDPSPHAPALFTANAADPGIWDYLPYGPFPDAKSYEAWMRDAATRSDPLFFTVHDLDTGLPGGVLSYLRIAPEAGSIELGHINFSPRLQRTRAATEAMLLTIAWAFEAGYRRFEWKCDALNLPSRRAAQRLGLSYEGIFRKAAVVKGRNRDTAWFAATDDDWPALQVAYESWLTPENFNESGTQLRRLGDLTRPVLSMPDPMSRDVN